MKYKVKKLIYPLIFLLSIQIVFAIYGGETIEIFDESCFNLTINVTVFPYQDENEFKLSSCELLNYSNTTSVFNCNCSIIYFTPAFNSIGNYTFDILYFYEEIEEEEEEIEEEDSGSGDGSSGGKKTTPRLFINISKSKSREQNYTIFCGNKICDKYENCSNCARDCGECFHLIILEELYCIDGELRCADGTLLICENENWNIKEICECIEGKCIKKFPLGWIILTLLIVLVITLSVYWFIKSRLYST